MNQQSEPSVSYRKDLHPQKAPIRAESVAYLGWAGEMDTQNADGRRPVMGNSAWAESEVDLRDTNKYEEKRNGTSV